MIELKTLEGPGVRCVIATHPVSRLSYRCYLRDAHLPVPKLMTLPAPASAPVIYVSQISAREYCKWLSSQEGHPFRLPTMSELLELYSEDLTEDGFSSDLWPHQMGHMPEMRGGLKELFLCEWTSEVEEIPQPNQRPPRLLGSIFYPTWLRQSVIAPQAHFQATEGYSFVTFRVAADN